MANVNILSQFRSHKWFDALGLDVSHKLFIRDERAWYFGLVVTVGSVIGGAILPNVGFGNSNRSSA